METLFIFTDGACSGNPGPGGWGYIITSGDLSVIKEDSGFISISTTNQRMEIQPILEALRYIKDNITEINSLRIYSDSMYCVNTINIWLKNWIAKDTLKNKANIDKWQEYIELSKNIKIKAIHVKGHAGHNFNERCNILAQKAIKERK